MHERPARTIIRTVSFATLVASACVLFGWFANIAILKSVMVGAITMKVNAAICLMAAAGVLFILHEAKWTAPRIAIAGIAFFLIYGIAFTTLAEYIFHFNAGIDEFFFTDIDGIHGRFPPGRMAPITALNFIFLATALALHLPGSRRQTVSQYFNAFVFLVALQSMVSTAIGVQTLFGTAFHNQMAIMTSILFVLLSSGTALLRPDRGLVSIVLSDTYSGAMARRLLLGVVLIPPGVHFFTAYAHEHHWIAMDAAAFLRLIGTVGFLAAAIWHTAAWMSQTEGRLSESEQNLQTLIGFAPVVLWSTDRNGIIVSCGGRALDSLGVTGEDLVGKSALALWPDSPDMGFAIQRGLEGLACEASHDFHGVPVDVRICPIIRPSGEVVGVVGLSLDMSSRKVADDERRRQEEMRREKEIAVAATRAKSLFLASMSHELRTPIHGIMGITWLLQESELNTEQRELLATLQASAEGLSRIINDILDFTKVEAGQLQIENRPYSLDEMLQQTLANSRILAQRKGLRLEVQIADGVSDECFGDAGRIQQVLTNLIGNGIKFTQSGHVAIDICETVGSAEEPVLRFAVTDTGVGIAPEAHAKLFQDFSQADASISRTFGGTGLGLAISRRLVELMGGKIEFSSVPGKGSSFFFTLPLRRVDRETGEAHAA